MKLVMIYGYARSGKTTLERWLRQQGYTVMSTSVELQNIVIERYDLPRYAIDLMQEKDDENFCKLPGVPTIEGHTTCRSVMIDTAQNWYIPRYGRNAFVERTFHNQLKPYPRNSDLLPVTFVTTLGGEEAEITKQVWSEMFDDDIIEFNLRSADEQPGVDIRKLNPEADEIYNAQFSPEDTGRQVMDWVLGQLLS